MLTYSHLSKSPSTDELTNLVELLELAFDYWQVALLVYVCEALTLVDSSLVYVYVGRVEVLGRLLIERQRQMNAVICICVVQL